MDERVMRFRVGVMFLATLLITAILLVMFGKLPKLMGTYQIKVEFGSAAGVTNYTPVRKCGILIGRVSEVQLIDNDSRVRVTLDIQSDKSVYHNEKCTISKDLFGDTALVFAPDPDSRDGRTPVARDEVLKGAISDDPTGLKKAFETALKSPVSTVEGTGKALTAASEQLGRAAKRVEDILDAKTEKNIDSVLENAAKSLESIQQALGDETNRDRLAEAVRELPKTIENMNKTFSNTNEIVSKFNERSKKDGKTSIERMVDTIEVTEKTLRKFTDSSADGQPAPADQIAKAMENINEITRLMRDILGRIDNGEGSLGALMKDRQLYDRLNHAAKNIEDVSRQLKPIVDDVRVFSDKVARHPGIIVRDAVKPGVGIK